MNQFHFKKKKVVGRVLNQPDFRHYFIFLLGLGLTSGICACKADFLPLKPYFQSILFWLL
jgi:hypothetical protein